MCIRTWLESITLTTASPEPEDVAATRWWNRLRPSPSWRFWPVTLIFIGFFLVAVLIMITASLRPSHADRYVSILGIMLGWPTLAFTMVLIVVLLFHEELISLINRVKSVSYRDATAEFQPIESRARELRIEPDPEAQIIAPEPIEPSEKVPAPDINTQKQNEQLRDEAKYWWRRFLTIMLNFRTQWILRVLADHYKGDTVSQEVLMFVASSRLATAGAFTQHLILGGTEPSTPLTIPKNDFQQSMVALESYGLVKTSNDGIVKSYKITDEGRDLLAFLDSPEGQEFRFFEVAGFVPHQRVGY